MFTSRENISYLEHRLRERGCLDSDTIITLDVHEYARTIPYSAVDSYEIALTGLNESYIRSKMCAAPSPRFHMLDGPQQTARVMTADEHLAMWRDRPAPHWLVREDPQGDQSAVNAPTPTLDYGDSDDIGVNRHIAMYEDTKYKRMLNRGGDHTDHVFGVATPASDARLLSRRIFRSEGGVENGIPLRERRLYRRVHDRDLSETLGGRERGYVIQRHDMSDIYPTPQRPTRRRAPPNLHQLGCD